MARRFLIWFWSGGGGGSQFAVNLAHRLSARFGTQAVALSMRADDPTLEQAHARGLNVRPAEITSDRRRPLATLAGLARSASVLAEHARDADVVIVPMNFATAGPLSTTLKQPLVYCAHDPAPHPGDYEPLLQRSTQSFLLKRAERVVALSDYAGDLLRARGMGDKLHVAPLVSVFEPRPVASTRSGPLRLLFAGRMIAYKGLDILADALDAITHDDGWRLTIAGHGPALDDSMVTRFHHPQVECVHRAWLSDADLNVLLSECDIVLAPYSSATQSGVVAQAQALGKPCVVTPVGALAEQIGYGEGGWVAGAANATALADVLVQVLKDDKAWTAKAAGAAAIAARAWSDDHWAWLDAI